MPGFQRADVLALALVVDLDDQRPPLTPRFDAHHARLVRTHAVLDRVLDQRLQRERRHPRVFHLVVDRGLHFEAPFPEPRLLDREIGARVIDLARDGRVLGVIEQVAIQIRKIADEVAGARRVFSNRRAQGVEGVEEKVRLEPSTKRHEREMIGGRAGFDERDRGFFTREHHAGREDPERHARRDAKHLHHQRRDHLEATREIAGDAEVNGEAERARELHEASGREGAPAGEPLRALLHDPAGDRTFEDRRRDPDEAERRLDAVDVEEPREETREHPRADAPEQRRDHHPDRVDVHVMLEPPHTHLGAPHREREAEQKGRHPIARLPTDAE